MYFTTREECQMKYRTFFDDHNQGKSGVLFGNEIASVKKQEEIDIHDNSE